MLVKLSRISEYSNFWVQNRLCDFNLGIGLEYNWQEHRIIGFYKCLSDCAIKQLRRNENATYVWYHTLWVSTFDLVPFVSNIQIQAALAIRGGYVVEIFREYQNREEWGYTVFTFWCQFMLNFS